MKQIKGKSRSDYIGEFSGGCTEFESLEKAVDYVSERFSLSREESERRITIDENKDWILLDDGAVIVDAYGVKAAEFLGAFPYGT